MRVTLDFTSWSWRLANTVSQSGRLPESLTAGSSLVYSVFNKLGHAFAGGSEYISSAEKPVRLGHGSNGPLIEFCRLLDAPFIATREERCVHPKRMIVTGRMAHLLQRWGTRR